MLCCIALHCVVLCCAMLCYVVLCCFMLCCVVLCCVVLCYVVYWCSYSVLQLLKYLSFPHLFINFFTFFDLPPPLLSQSLSTSLSIHFYPSSSLSLPLSPSAIYPFYLLYLPDNSFLLCRLLLSARSSSDFYKHLSDIALELRAVLEGTYNCIICVRYFG